MAAYALITDPFPRHISAYASKVVEALLVKLGRRIAKLAEAERVANWPTGGAQDDLVYEGQFIGNVAEELDGDLQQGRLRILDGISLPLLLLDLSLKFAMERHFLMK